MKRRTSRLYTRDRAGVPRYYGDFRDFVDVGGKQEALIAPGETLATTDQDVAQLLASERVKQLEGKRRSRAILGVTSDTPLGQFASHHLVEKKRAGRVTDLWLSESEMELERAVDYFGAGRPLNAITTADMNGYVANLRTLPSGRRNAEGKDGTLSGGTIRHHLNTLSNLYRRAQAEGCVLPGYNPVAALMEKPSAARQEARWLEIPEAAALLEAARTYKPKRGDIALPFAYPLLATFLLTGGRRAEVLGLEVEDVSFDRRTVTFRPNAWRRLKTSTSLRSVPLWPQLEEILRAYVFDRPPRRLLFPSTMAMAGTEAMLVEPRKILDAIGKRAGWKPGEIRAKMFRHTYCAARLQTLDAGAPVSAFTVAKELGHGGEAMVRRVYGHLGQYRHRSEAVEYRMQEVTVSPVAPQL